MVYILHNMYRWEFMFVYYSIKDISFILFWMPKNYLLFYLEIITYWFLQVHY